MSDSELTSLGANMISAAASVSAGGSTSTKITFDQIASVLLKNNLVLTALEFHTELAEVGKEVPRLRDYFSNPANFEQSHHQQYNGDQAGFPLHKASSIQTFDSLDLTRYSDDADQNREDRIAVLEFELRKAKETISQLRTTLTIATESQSNQLMKSASTNSNSLPVTNSNSNMNLNLDDLKRCSYASNDYDLSPGRTDYVEVSEESSGAVGGFTTPILSSYDIIPASTITKAVKSISGTSTVAHSSHTSGNTIMPHDKNALNFLINEYLLENSYKMTSVTFSEENESQDLEDWDVVGLNRSKPPKLYQLYKSYLQKHNLIDDCTKTGGKNKTKSISTNEQDTQTEMTERVDAQVNTSTTTSQDFDSMVNFDREIFDSQHKQINKLLEKQEVLLKSLAKLEDELARLNSEREVNLRKIDHLAFSLEKANSTIKSQLTEIEEKRHVQLDEKIEVKDEVATETSEPKATKEESINERKIPIVFKEALNKYMSIQFSPSNEEIIKEMSQISMTTDYLINLLYRNISVIAKNTIVEKRLELLPLILLLAIFEQEEMNQNKQTECRVLKTLFDLIDKPNLEERSMILTSCVHFTKHAGPTYVQNYLLPLCWEQLNEKPSEEKRIFIAEACSTLAPHIYNDIRNSLMFSILKQIMEHDSSELVRVHTVKSFAILINYLRDEQKFVHCLELLDLCATDSSQEVIEQVEKLMMPSLSLWALSLTKSQFRTMVNRLLEKIEFHLLNSIKQKYNKKPNESEIAHDQHAETYLRLLNLNLQFVFAYILVHFREQDSSSSNSKIVKLNDYYHSLQQKLDVKLDLYKLDSVLEDYLSLTDKYLNLIATDSWSSNELSDAFEWLGDKFLVKLIQMSAQVEAKDSLCPYFVAIFRSFTLLFAIDYEFIKSKIISIFEKLLKIPTNELDPAQQSLIEQQLNNKSCPLYKSTLPVYFVGILSTLIDVEYYGWFDLNSSSSVEFDHLRTTVCTNMETSPSSLRKDKVISSSASSQKISSPPTRDSKLNESQSSSTQPQTQVDKRIDYMSNYLKNVFFALSLNQANLDGLIAIYELLKQKTKSFDYVIQMLLSTLWDGIVHNSLYVRVNTARLFEILVKDCDEYLLSTRILPALITLANDLDKLVRCSSISPLTSIIENCTNREILERVYTQLQSFLSDPILKDEYLLQIELLKTFRRIITKVNVKFREEFVLPYLAILSMQIKTVINENDYEFTTSSLSVLFQTLSSFNSSTFISTIHSSPASTTPSPMSSNYSINSHQQIQNQQQDLARICVLLLDIYQKLINPSNEMTTISRQSCTESLLPGLACLQEIFHNRVIVNTSTQSSSTNTLSNNQNEYANQVDMMIARVEQIASLTAPVESATNAKTSSIFSTPKIISDVKNAQVGTNLTELVNSSVTAISNASSITTPVTTFANQLSQINVAEQNSNFKSFFSKGINNFKDQSKDKLSNFLSKNNNKIQNTSNGATN